MKYNNLKVGDIFEVEEKDGSVLQYIKIPVSTCGVMHFNAVCIDEYNDELRGCFRYFLKDENVFVIGVEI